LATLSILVTSDRRRARDRRGRAFFYRSQDALAVPERHAELLEVAVGELGQDFEIDVGCDEGV
jgi:hypothetical protein